MGIDEVINVSSDDFLPDISPPKTRDRTIAIDNYIFYLKSLGLKKKEIVGAKFRYRYKDKKGRIIQETIELTRKQYDMAMERKKNEK